MRMLSIIPSKETAVDSSKLNHCQQNCRLDSTTKNGEFIATTRLSSYTIIYPLITILYIFIIIYPFSGLNFSPQVEVPLAWSIAWSILAQSPLSSCHKSRHDRRESPHGHDLFTGSGSFSELLTTHVKLVSLNSSMNLCRWKKIHWVSSHWVPFSSLSSQFSGYWTAFPRVQSPLRQMSSPEVSLQRSMVPPPASAPTNLCQALWK